MSSKPLFLDEYTMPFTFGGDWAPRKPLEKKPVKLSIEKRKNGVVTVVSNLPLEKAALKNLAGKIKSTLGCGGTINEESLEFQGNHLSAIEAMLKKENLIYTEMISRIGFGKPGA
jgi:translation initiation factor 1 (eIF-1/SUI1)